MGNIIIFYLFVNNFVGEVSPTRAHEILPIVRWLLQIYSYL